MLQLIRCLRDVRHIEGKAHALPDFAEALAVQETIEAMLAGESLAAA